MPSEPMITIASLNVNGVVDRNRFRDFLLQMQKDNVAVLTLQDTHHDEELLDRLNDDFANQVSILAGTGPDRLTGVMILIDKSRVKFVGTEDELEALNEWGAISGRLLVAPMKTDRETFTVRCVYMPSRENERAAFGVEWRAAMRNNPRAKNKCDFLCGDWNMTVDPEDSSSSRIPTARDIRLHRNMLEDLMTEFEDQIDGWRQYHPDQRVYSHKNTAFINRPDMGESRIDRIYVREDWYLSTREWNMIPVGLTDHKMVTVGYCPANRSWGDSGFRMI